MDKSVGRMLNLHVNVQCEFCEFWYTQQHVNEMLKNNPDCALQKLEFFINFPF